MSLSPSHSLRGIIRDTLSNKRYQGGGGGGLLVRYLVSIVDTFNWFYMIIVLESEGVDTRVNSQGLAHCDTSRAFRNDCTSVLLLAEQIVRWPVSEVVAAVQYVVRVVMTSIRRNVLHDFLIIEIIIVVVREFV